MLQLWMRLAEYGVLIINTTGSVSYGMWNLAANTIEIQLSLGVDGIAPGESWASIKERDDHVTDRSITIYAFGIIEQAKPRILTDFRTIGVYPITFKSLSEANATLAEFAISEGYSVYI